MAWHGMACISLVVADEVDQLVRGKDTSVLTDLFLLPSLHAHSRCILIGISNSIHLIDSLLPHLSRPNSMGVTARPTLLPFPAYDRNQIYEILSQRLQAAGGMPVGAAARGAAVEAGAQESACTSFSFDPMALHLCARVPCSPTHYLTSQFILPQCCLCWFHPSSLSLSNSNNLSRATLSSL
ncbi:unnamed protein product [Closterium sp. NIES-54]